MPDRILIVDDQKEIVALLSAQLEQRGYEVHVAYNGSKALEIVKTTHPDLILLDIMMPQPDGFKVCQALRSSEETSHIPVILLTALTQIHDKAKGFSVGANDYVTKPYDIDDLQLRIDAQLKWGRDLLRIASRRAKSQPAAMTSPYPQAGGAKTARHSPVQHPRVSVIVPTLNEVENLPYVLPRIPRWVDEVLLVDGHSTDGTVALARRLLPSIRIVMQPGKGKGDALRHGFSKASGHVIVMLDADGSTDPAEIPAFVGALLAGADYAKGTRFLQGAGTTDMPLFRKLGNLGFVLIVRVLFGGTYSDLLYGYNAFWKDVLPYLELSADGFEIETEMNIRALRADLKIAEVASFESERIGGNPKLQPMRDGMRILKLVLREYSRKVRKTEYAGRKRTSIRKTNG